VEGDLGLTSSGPAHEPPDTALADALPREVDVLVAGSGAAGLTAALTAATSGLSVLLIESAGRWGGTSAISGGRVWLPPGAGTNDSRDAAIEYLAAVFGSDHMTMIEAFVEGARPMARFVESHCRHRFVPCPNYPDYHPHLPGWSPGGRPHDAAPIDLNDLVAEASDVLLPPGYLPITHAEWEQWRYPSRFEWDLIEERRRGRNLTNGASLVASLVDGAICAGAKLTKGVALLDVVPGASPIRARVSGDETETTISAGALILATGGFDAHPDMVASFLPRALSATAAAPTNTGVALRLALDSGLAVDNLSEGWWMPVVMVPDEEIAGSPYPRALVRERGVPHQIVVNRAGARFVDEATPYHEFVKAMHLEVDGLLPNREAWLVFDGQFRTKYSFPGLAATGAPPAHVETDTAVEGLAARVGIEPAALAATIDRWNGICGSGRDPDFGRGENSYDRYYGDPRLEQSPNLGTIEQPPFYAAPIMSGSVGSKGGPVTTEDGQVVDTEGRPRPGWYAVGNASAFWTGDGYPGPGATLGIGMTFGHRAAIDAIRFVKSKAIPLS
jgi:succinate dehydrogenase/fumarate reductase flavoprotein subunit